MRQFFAAEKLNVGDSYFFDDRQYHHLRNVLRMKSGDALRIVGSDGSAFLAELLYDGEAAFARLLERSFITEQREIICIASLIKREKWEWLIQKACELGASRIVALETRRTIVHLEEKASKKLERWNKIALEACQQANRSSVCEVSGPVKLREIEQFKRDVNIVAYENESGRLLKEVLTAGNVCFVIGPEGGFDSSEIDYLNSIGFESVSLGERILRAETASLFVLSVLEALR